MRVLRDRASIIELPCPHAEGLLRRSKMLKLWELYNETENRVYFCRGYSAARKAVGGYLPYEQWEALKAGDCYINSLGVWWLGREE